MTTVGEVFHEYKEMKEIEGLRDSTLESYELLFQNFS